MKQCVRARVCVNHRFRVCVCSPAATPLRQGELCVCPHVRWCVVVQLQKKATCFFSAFASLFPRLDGTVASLTPAHTHMHTHTHTVAEVCIWVFVGVGDVCNWRNKKNKKKTGFGSLPFGSPPDFANLRLLLLSEFYHLFVFIFIVFRDFLYIQTLCTKQEQPPPMCPV